jgi:hypothetical protein
VRQREAREALPGGTAGQGLATLAGENVERAAGPSIAPVAVMLPGVAMGGREPDAQPEQRMSRSTFLHGDPLRDPIRRTMRNKKGRRWQMGASG